MLTRIFLSLVFCFVMLVEGCSRESSNHLFGKNGNNGKKILAAQLMNEPVSLDPSLAQDGVSLQVLNNLYDGLVGYDEEGHLQNRLAESYRISPDGKRYEFTLRPNVKWSDGKSIQGTDFALALQRALGPHTRSQFAPLYFSIRGAKAYHDDKATAHDLGITANENHLIIELERPAPIFIQALTLPTALPLRKDVLDAHQGNWPEDAPVTGPYRLMSHEVNQRLRFERNPNYWGKAPLIDEVHLWVVADEMTGIHLFDQGRVDILMRIPSLDFLRLKKEGRVVTTPFLATYFLSFNCRKPPFNDRNWRRAVAAVIQRQEIAAFLGAGEQPAWSWIPYGLEGFIPYRNPTEVYLDSLQWAKNQKAKDPSMILGFDSSSRNSTVMEKVQEDLRKSLGLKTSLSQSDWKTYVRLLHTDPPSLFRYGWQAPFNDPIIHLKVFASGDLNNFSGFSNHRYDQLVEEIEGMVPGSARKAKIVEAQKIILDEEAAVIPIYHYIQNTAVSARVKNLKVNPFGIVLFRDLDLN